MDSTICLDRLADLPNFQAERRILKSFLHFSWAELPQIPTSGGAAALGVLLSNICEIVRILLKLSLEIGNILASFIEGASDWFIPV